MIYPDEPIYVISRFFPGDNVRSAYEFSVGLKSELALKAYNKELTETGFNYLENMRKKILKRCGLNYSDACNYRFVENDNKNPTCLLHWCKVEGDACSLGIDGTELNSMQNSFKKKDLSNLKLIGYYPHNIDSMRQAYSLLSIWIQWADFAYSSTRQNNN